MSNPLDSDIKFLPGIGPKRGGMLQKEFGISTFRDMLYFFPFRYIDRSRIYTISEIQPTTAYIQIRGKITRMALIGATPKSKRLSIMFSDPTGAIVGEGGLRTESVAKGDKPGSSGFEAGTEGQFIHCKSGIYVQVSGRVVLRSGPEGVPSGRSAGKGHPAFQTGQRWKI